MKRISGNSLSNPLLINMSSDKYALALHNNPQPRCPVVLLLDTSTSMQGKPIDELHEGVDQFFQEVGNDPFARLSVETAVITFGHQVKTILDFHSMAQDGLPFLPRIEAHGLTPMGEAITEGLSLIDNQRQSYRKAGVSSYKPWIVLLTDGEPNDDWADPAGKAQILTETHQLVFFGIGIGPHVNEPLLADILPAKYPPARMKGLRFKAFFRWLSDSLSNVSRDSVGSNPSLPPTSDWAEGDWDWAC